MNRPAALAQTANHDRGGAVVPAPENGSPRRSGANAADWLAALPVLIAFWIATRPYYGIYHDARFYAVLALERLDPGRFAADFFFASGSHDTFTAFSVLYAPLIARIGLTGAHEAGLIAVHGAWLAALAWLASTVFPRPREAILAVAGVILLSPAYALFGMFGYGEPFLTPRPLAEAAVMGALALALRRQWAGAAALLLAGVAMHPLMTLPGIVVVSLLAARAHRVVLILGFVLLTACLGLAFAGVDPFRRIFVTYDTEWWEIARERGAFTVVAAWTYLDWLRPAPAVLVSAMALLHAAQGGRASADAPGAGALAIALVSAAASLAITWLGVDLARNLLVASVQPWRALWLLTLMANGWAAVLAQRLPAAAASRQFLIVALVISMIEVWLASTPISSVPVYAAALVAMLVEGKRQRPLPRLLGWIGALACILSLAHLGSGLIV